MAIRAFLSNVPYCLVEVVCILGSRRVEDRVNTKNLFSRSQYTILRNKVVYKT
jgi:hypothetical protein